MPLTLRRNGVKMDEYYKFENTPLPYAYNALEPYIDTKTMELHHDRHLQTYINNLNALVKKHPQLQEWTLEKMVCYSDRLPRNDGMQLRFNAGGVYNHEFFFEGLTPPNNREAPIGNLAEAINETFLSFDGFKNQFKQAAMSVMGSGYAWLVLNKRCELQIVITSNQMTPICERLCPILNLDVWEHAHYLKHYNQRAAYIDDWFHVINWERALGNYLRCTQYCY